MSTGIALLDVAIGVIFAILTFSLVASTLQEAIASILNWRGRVLRRGLFRLLQESTKADTLIGRTLLPKDLRQDAELTLEFLKDPSIRALQGSKSWLGRQFAGNTSDPDLEEVGRMPSAIPRESFAKALIDTLRRKLMTTVVTPSPPTGAAPPPGTPATQAGPLEAFARKAAEDALNDAKATYEAVRAGAATEAQKAYNDMIAKGIKPDDPATLADNILNSTVGVVKPEVAYIQAYVRSLAGALSDINDGVGKMIAELPMSEDLKQRLRKAIAHVSVVHSLTSRLDDISDTLDVAEDEVTRIIRELEAKIAETAEEISAWFDRGMDRVSGWYVRRAKYVLFALGFAMAGAVNFDMLSYGGQLLKDEALRNQIVANAVAADQTQAVGELKVSVGAPLTLLAGQIDTNNDGKIDDAEIEKFRFDTKTLDNQGYTLADLGLDPADIGIGDPAVEDGQVVKGKRAGVIDVLNPYLNGLDRNGDGKITEQEIEEVVNATLDNVKNKLDLSLETLNDQLAVERLNFGWRACKTEPDTMWICAMFNCFWNQLSLVAVLSWFLIGMGCTLGGQFWFDLMKRVIGVRAAASGIDSDLKKLAGRGQGNPQNASATQ